MSPKRTQVCLLVILIGLSTLYLSSCNTSVQAAKTPTLPTPSPTPTPSVTVTLAPTTANIRAGSSLTFRASVSGTTDATVEFSVNGTAGGSASVGTIDASGNYTAPSALPSPNTITIAATSHFDKTKSSTSNVTLLNPTPTIVGISPVSINIGALSMAVTGTNFVKGAHVLLGSTELATSFVSSTRLTATGTVSTAGTFPITVENPDPGSSSSSSVNFEVNAAAAPQASSCSVMSIGQGASLNGYEPFPADSLWKKDISSSPVDPNSAAIINFIGAGRGLHPDFGSGPYQGSYMGIPYVVVNGSQAQVPINYTAYGSESDPGPMAIPLNAPIEGYPTIPSNGDRHVLVLDNSNCFLYELFGAVPEGSSWNARAGAVWDLLADEHRPYGWTSVDAAGMAVFPGLIRYDEIAAGSINHAIRISVAYTRAAFTPPASHWAANSNSLDAPPMGTRLRLKASFDVSKFSKTNQIIFNAMKKYGLIIADNGTSMYVGGTPDDRWDNGDLHQIDGAITSDFEVVEISPLYTASNMPTGSAPTITDFKASSTSVSAGTSVTLSWETSGASYVIVSPSIGATRSTSVTVAPTATTTYTLYATNAFGRTTSTVTVTVK